MKHPSIRTRLMAGTGFFVALVLTVSLVVIYQSVSRMLLKEVRLQLFDSASLLTKSSELEPDRVVYEWEEALKSNAGSSLSGLFQFWDLKSGKSVPSPAMGSGSLEIFHGELDEPVLREITLPDGRPAVALGILHLPFLDAAARKHMEEAGKLVDPADFPQVLVCAREIATIDIRLARLRFHLLWAGGVTMVAIWLSIFLIIEWTLRPIRQLADRFDQRSKLESGLAFEIPVSLPTELRGLADTFNHTLSRIEAARDRERDFALHAAHELRTPVAGIQATLEQALNRERSADDLRERIAMALAVTEGMRGVIGSLMKLARARGGLEKPLNKAFDLATLVRKLVATSQPRFDSCGHRIEWKLNFEGDVVSDRELVELVITTMLDNVVCHAPPKSPIVMGLDRVGQTALIFTENPCNDLTEEDLNRVMEPFQRGGHSRMEGAGLGLSLAREIAALIGGHLDMELIGGILRVQFQIPIK